jgi:cytochrome P450
MPASPDEVDILSDLRARCPAEHGVFWMREGELGVFDPEAAQQVNAANFSDLTLPDRLVDLLLRRRSKAVSWKQVRAAWIAQLRRLTDAEGIGGLAARMDALLAERLDRPMDLVWAAQQVCTQALVPVVVAGLPPADLRRVLRDQDYKLRRLLTLEAKRETFQEATRAILIQVGGGLAVRRELRGCARGRRPRQLDLTDPIVDLLPDLGMDRAVDAVTAVLTAIAGPPGSAAACLVYELTRRPDWAARLRDELAAIPPEQLYAAPTRVAPVTHRFVKETLRMWTPPLLMTRGVRTDIDLERVSLKAGQRYFLSAYLIHHDPRHWKDPDVFDPDRWLSGAENGPCSGASYVPFGWSPRACIGASLGTIQLILLCRLLCTRYRVQVEDPEAVRMALVAVPLPRNLHGTIARSAEG